MISRTRWLATLLLVVPTGCSRPAPLDIVRLTDVWAAASPLRDDAAPQASIAGVTRIGFPLRVGTVERLTVVVPRDAELRGSVGLIAGRSGSRDVESASLQIGPCDSEGISAPPSEVIAEVRANAERWSPLRADLALWSNERVELCLAAIGARPPRPSEPFEAWLFLAGATLERRGARPRSSQQPNLILLTGSAETLEGELVTGPALESLMRQSELFGNGLMNAPESAFAHAALLSGLHPRELPEPTAPVPGSEAARGAEILARSVRSLPELFWALGYDTAAFVSDPALAAERGFAQGFDVYDARASRDGGGLALPSEGGALDRALTWIDSRSAAFFLFVNRSSRGRGGPARVLDVDVERLVAHLRRRGEYERTMIVIVPVEDRRRITNAPTSIPSEAPPLLDRQLRIPFVVKYARPISSRRMGARYDHRVDLLDLRSGIMREMGLRDEFDRTRLPKGPPRPPGLYGLHEGRNHHFAEANLDRGETSAGASRASADLQAVYELDWKLVRDDRAGRWLSDLAVDPSESRNLASSDPSTVARLDALLDAWESTAPRDAPIEDLGRFPPELAERVEE